MLLNEPGRTDYDFTFSIFGFEVRTHPAFFIMPILLGRGLIPPDVNTGVGWLLLIAIFFVSVLIHELGHAFAFRYFGVPSRIVLYWMGGLAIPDSGGNVWNRHQGRSLHPNEQIIVSLAGPVAGLILGAIICGLVYAIGGTLFVPRGFIIPVPVPDLQETAFAQHGVVWMVLESGILLNILLNLLNLIPIYPLDGGQIARQIMIQMDPWNGLKNSLFLSIAACLIMIVLGLKYDHHFLAIFFGMMAWSNYQSLQGYGGSPW